MQLSVGTKIPYLFFLAGALVCFLGGIAFFYIDTFSQEIQRILTNEAFIAQVSEEIRGYVLEARRAEQNFVLLRDEAFVKEHAKIMAKLRTALQAGQEASWKEYTKTKYGQIEELLEQYETRFSLLGNTDREAWEKRVNFSLELRTLVEEILQLTHQLSQDMWSELALHAQDISRVGAVAKRNILLIIAVTLVSSLLLGLYLPGKIVGPMRHHNGNTSLSTCFVRNDGRDISDMIVVCRERGETEKWSYVFLKEEQIQEIVSEIVTGIREALNLPKEVSPPLRETKPKYPILT